MKEIIITFLTKKGEAAYRSVEAAGARETGVNKRIVKRIYRDSVVSKTPLVVRIEVKIPRLAVATELDKQIIKCLEAEGAVVEKDFTLEVKWR